MKDKGIHSGAEPAAPSFRAKPKTPEKNNKNNKKTTCLTDFKFRKWLYKDNPKTGFAA